MNETSLILDLMQGFTLKDIVLAIEDLPNSLNQTYFERAIPIVISIISFAFSLWIYYKDQFREVFNITIKEIINCQEKISFNHFLSKLDNIYKGNSSEYDFNQFNFYESRTYNQIIKLLLENMRLLQKNRLLPKKYYVNFFQSILSNETLWIASLYCLQKFSEESKEQKEFIKLWKTFGFYKQMTVFYDKYSIDEFYDMSNEEVNKIDERIISKNDIYNVILNEIKSHLNKE